MTGHIACLVREVGLVLPDLILPDLMTGHIASLVSEVNLVLPDLT